MPHRTVSWQRNVYNRNNFRDKQDCWIAVCFSSFCFVDSQAVKNTFVFLLTIPPCGENGETYTYG